MEIIHALSKLKIETTDHSSFQEEEDKRNWLDLHPDVTSLIFLKLSTLDILGSVQWVCSSWWKLSKQPHLFRSIQVESLSAIFGHPCDLPISFMTELSKGMAREAIDRSCGQLVELYVQAMPIDDLLHCMSEKSSSLRSLRLVKVRLVGYDYSDYYDDYLRNDEIIEDIAKKIPHLEELEIIKCSEFSKDVIESFGRFCPQLKSCRINCESSFWDDTLFNKVPLAIAENMPELRHLNLFGNPLTEDDLRAILDGCPHLESLDLRRCFKHLSEQDLKEICKNIKVLRLPNDPTDDYEYDSDNEYEDDYGSGHASDHWADHYDGYLSM